MHCLGRVTEMGLELTCTGAGYWLGDMHAVLSVFLPCSYPAWLLAALMVSLYLLLHHFVRAILWCESVGECLQDVESCLAGTGNRQVWGLHHAVRVRTAIAAP